MNRRTVITGIGLLTPLGIGTRETWDGVLMGRSALRPVRKFDASALPGCFAGEIDDFDAKRYMPLRLARKLDPYTQYALAACQMALRDGSLDLAAVDRSRFGVYVGNCFGGWEYTDQQLRNLHTQGVHTVSPYQATAWFPAAPQGQISILFGLRGHSKTLVCDRASGLLSIGYAARAIVRGDCDVMLAGGTEAPVTPFAYLAGMTEGSVSIGGPAERAYLPFDAERQGFVQAEGAAFLLVEEREHALRRGATIYAELQGFALNTAACHPATQPLAAHNQDRYLAAAMQKALADAELTAADVSLIMADGAGTLAGDTQEAQGIHDVFGNATPHIPVTVPKSLVGHTYGAAGALDAALAALALRHGVVPPMARGAQPDPACGLTLATSEAAARSLSNVLINSRGVGGMNAALVMSR
ncbi:MAG: beta-ketoacyl-[acyl-carrier-protein] synthase family protein [Polyangia bacterium]